MEAVFLNQDTGHMAWLIGGLALILFIAPAGLRKFFAATVALAAILGAGVWILDQAERDLSKKRITHNELRLENLSLSAPASNYDSHHISGRIYNDSKAHELSSLTLKLQYRECADHQSSCTTIGESAERIDLSIPPQQARNFKKTLHKAPASGTDWTLEVTEIISSR